MIEGEVFRSGKFNVMCHCRALTGLLVGWLLPGPAPVARGRACAEVRQVPAFGAITVLGCASVRFSASPHHALRLIGPAQALAGIQTRVTDGRLVIESQTEPAGTVRIEVTGPALEAITLAGSGTVTANGLAGDSVCLDIEGSGNIVAHGCVAHGRIHVAGSGKVDGSVLKAAELEVRLSGTGDIRAYAAQRAQVTMTGSGRIVIAGNPAQRNVSRVGSGSVQFN